MFFKFLKKQTLNLALLAFFIIPINISAYSDRIIASGSTVGIRLNTDGIIVAGTYEINGLNPAFDAGLRVGDVINKINNTDIDTVEEMVSIIKTCNCDNLNINYNNSKKTILKLVSDDNTKKTGLYVKDTISGIGTLTFIDPETKKFGVLGHEIASKETNNIIPITDGTIFESTITGVTRSDKGTPGEKNAILYSNNLYGKVKENTKKGIFGDYTSIIGDTKLYKVGDIKDIKMGDAKILTVIDSKKIEEFNIKILNKKNTSNKLKNIEFEITDKNLLSKTNGVVQGMSGSPIIQDDYIIGAVTHVVIDNPHKGYGILIKNMLEEAEN